MTRGLVPAARSLLIAVLVAACGVLPGTGATPSPSGPAPLAAGTHTSVAFRPAMTYTVPAGWTNSADDSTYFELMPVLDQNNGIHVFRDWQALSQASDCPFTRQPNVGTSAIELVTWIRSLKGLSVSQPVMVTVGGIPATSIDVRIAQGWTTSCPFANGLPAVPLLIDPATTLHWVIADKEALRLYLLDVPGQGTVIVDLDSFDGDGFQTLLANAAPVVRSLAFATK